MPETDLLHADLQGEEAAVLPAAMAALSARVRRVVVGTHGRGIEEVLLRAFGEAGWELEADAPCAYAQSDGDSRPALSRDGTQAWRNPRL